MNFNRFYFQVVSRVLLLLANLICMAFILQGQTLWFTFFCLAILAIVQVVELVWFVNTLQKELVRFFNGIKYNDYNTRFSNPKLGKRFKELSETFHAINRQLKAAKIDKEAQLELFIQLTEKLNIGMIAYQPQSGHIVLMNQSAKDLLAVSAQKNWNILKQRTPWFTQVVESISYGGKKLASFEDALGKKEFSIDVSMVNVNNAVYKLVSFQDIKNEIEQKEIEAWHKLIRILTHEIMNSITPVSSLSETMIQLLSGSNSALSENQLANEMSSDLLLAAKTIHKRSNGMLAFVDDYRKLTNIPAPNFELIRIVDLFEDMAALMQAELTQNKIALQIVENGLNKHIKCDRILIEQVMINLFSNAIYALKNTAQPSITLSAENSEQTIVLKISDNGSGIEKQKLERIFIPFYSTKEHGSGIGLALSKNIMQVHQGNLTVKSKPGVETSFSLTFLNHAYL